MKVRVSVAMSYSEYSSTLKLRVKGVIVGHRLQRELDKNKCLSQSKKKPETQVTQDGEASDADEAAVVERPPIAEPGETFGAGEDESRTGIVFFAKEGVRDNR
jgi:hypothetical protein